MGLREEYIPRVNPSNNSDEPLSSLLQDKIGDFIWIYISPLLLVLGTVGNVLSVLVLLRKPMRRSTTMFYLTCLSIGDLFTLYTGLLRYWIQKAFNIDVRNFSDIGCKIHVFSVYVSLDFTVWILVAVTIDRCLSVTLPFKARRICTFVRSKLVVLVIFAALTLKNMHFLWNLKVVTLSEASCEGKSESARDFIWFVWPWIDLSTFCLIPFTIMIMCNLKIIHRIVKSQRKLQAHRLLFNSQTSSQEPHVLNCDGLEMSEGVVRFKDQRVVVSTSNKTLPPIVARKGSTMVSTVTTTLLTVNCVFLVTTTPIQVFLIGEQYWFSNRTPEELAWHNCWWSVVNILQYSNNCVHFFLYCLTGPRFRYELKCMFRRSHRVSVAGEYVSDTEHRT